MVAGRWQWRAASSCFLFLGLENKTTAKQTGFLRQSIGAAIPFHLTGDASWGTDFSLHLVNPNKEKGYRLPGLERIGLLGMGN